jgi:MFS family permease
VAHVVDQGVSRAVAASILGASGILASIAGIFWGAISDRIGREPVWALGCTGYFVALLVLLVLGPDRTWMLYVLVIFQGFLGGAMAPLYASIPAEIFPGRHYGAVLGCLSVGAGLGSALGPWFGGLLYDATGSYRAAFLLALGAVAASALAIWLAAPRKIRRIGH